MMNFGRQAFFALGASLFFGTLASTSHATVVIFEMNNEFSGGTAPVGVAPWMTATIDDGGGSGSVTLTMSNINLTGSEFTRSWYFNLDPTLNPNSLIFSAPTKVGTFTSPTISTGVNMFQADGDGKYDILFEFATGGGANGRFMDNESVQYTITGIPTLNANSFMFLSAPAGGNGPFYTASHVQGIGTSGQDSGWVSGEPVPEPASLLTLGALSALVAARRRKR